jgi:hypothetical protein
MPEQPPNIEEFNTIAGLILAQLYRAFPVQVQRTLIDRQSIAATMGAGGDESIKLKSGRSFGEMYGSTLLWLVDENFVLAPGNRQGQGGMGPNLVLSNKGLTALNTVRPGFKQSLGSELAEGSSSGDTARVADVMGYLGSFAGGFIRSWTS